MQRRGHPQLAIEARGIGGKGSQGRPHTDSNNRA
jgi:hypothetical protein